MCSRVTAGRGATVFCRRVGATCPNSTVNKRSGSETEQHRDPGTGAGATCTRQVYSSRARRQPHKMSQDGVVSEQLSQGVHR